MATVKFVCDESLKAQFEKLCKGERKDMTKAFNHFMEICVLNSLNPTEIDIILKQSMRNLVQKYHDHTASFLKTMEANLFELLQKQGAQTAARDQRVFQAIEALMKKYSIEKSVTDEILFNTQIILDSADEEAGRKIFERNTNNILEKEKEVLART